HFYYLLQEREVDDVLVEVAGIDHKASALLEEVVEVQQAFLPRRIGACTKRDYWTARDRRLDLGGGTERDDGVGFAEQLRQPARLALCCEVDRQQRVVGRLPRPPGHACPRVRPEDDPRFA